MNYSSDWKSWRSSYTFPGIFYTNIILISLATTFTTEDHSSQFYFLMRFLIGISTGFLYDYMQTQILIILIYTVSIIISIWSYVGIAVVVSAQEVIILSYICEVTSDGSKFIALAEAIVLQSVMKATGTALGFYFQIELISKIFFAVCCLVLILVNGSLFKEIPKKKRPNFTENNTDPVFPKPIGLSVCFLLMATTGFQSSAFSSCLELAFYTANSPIPSILTICLAPFVVYLSYTLITLKDIKQIMLIFLALSSITWLFQVKDYFFYVSLSGMISTAWFIKSSTLLILSRILGPFYNGKFIGFVLSLEAILPTSGLKDPTSIYIIGIGLSIVSFFCLLIGKQYCEYHREYTISQTITSNNNGVSRLQFKIKLQRPSVFENSPRAKEN